MDTFVLALRIVVLLIVLYAAFEDVRHMRLRNEFCLAIVILFAPVLFTLDLHGIGMHILSAVLVLVVTAAMFFFRLIGGGDAKLLAALSLWYTPHELPALLMIMTIAGGLLGLVALIIKKSNVLAKISVSHPKLLGPEDGWLANMARGEMVVPYGIAIAIACALTIS